MQNNIPNDLTELLEQMQTEREARNAARTFMVMWEEVRAGCDNDNTALYLFNILLAQGRGRY